MLIFNDDSRYNIYIYIYIYIGITVSLIFHNFFLVLWWGVSICLPFHFLWFSLSGPLRRLSPLYGRFSFFYKSRILARSSGSVSVVKFQRMLCVSFSEIDSGMCINYLPALSNFNFLHDSHWITGEYSSKILIFFLLCEYSQKRYPILGIEGTQIDWPNHCEGNPLRRS